MSPSATKTIEDVTETLIDYRGKTPTKTPSGVKLITAKVIKEGRILDGPHEYIAEEDYDTWMRRGLPRQWDILVTTEAPLGEVAILRSAEKVALAQRVILLRGKPALIDQRYYYQALKSPFVLGELSARSSGTTVLGIKQSELRQVRIPYFPLNVQRKIAGVLSAYDDLIENNTRRITILEEMAQAIYREWFVHFRFPGHNKVKLVPSPLGPIPKGWSGTKLAKVASVNELSIRRGEEPQEIIYVDIASVSPGSIDEKKPMRFEGAPGRARRIVRHGDTIWSMVRPNRKSFTLVLDPEPNLIVSTGFAVLSPTGVPFSFLHHAVITDDFVGYLANRATGAAYPAVKAEDFERANVLWPERGLLDRFHALVAPMLEMKEHLGRKNGNLRRTRDLLLPKLISGELDVSDFDIQVERAV